MIHKIYNNTTNLKNKIKKTPIRCLCNLKLKFVLQNVATINSVNIFCRYRARFLQISDIKPNSKCLTWTWPMTLTSYSLLCTEKLNGLFQLWFANYKCTSLISNTKGETTVIWNDFTALAKIKQNVVMILRAICFFFFSSTFVKY